MHKGDWNIDHTAMVRDYCKEILKTTSVAKKKINSLLSLVNP